MRDRTILGGRGLPAPMALPIVDPVRSHLRPDAAEPRVRQEGGGDQGPGASPTRNLGVAGLRQRTINRCTIASVLPIPGHPKNAGAGACSCSSPAGGGASSES